MTQRMGMIVMFLLGALVGMGVLMAVSQVPSAAQIRAIAETVVAEQQAPAPVAAPLDEQAITALIDDHLMKNPQILSKMNAALEASVEAEKTAKTKAAIASIKDQIYSSPGHAVVGNPEGDVTLVEFYDYNCGYCRTTLPDLVALLKEDPGIRLILKEFPILTAGSLDAARIAVQVAANPKVDYWEFYQRLYSTRGQVDKAAALAVAAEMGLDTAALEAGMNSQVVADEIRSTYQIAEKLGITGTPSFIIGDSMVPGAVGADALREMVKNMRACGAITCETDQKS